MNKLSIAIDGPSGAGKSTIAKAVAQKLGIIYVDTGALYRTIGLFVFRNGFDATNKDEIISLLPKINITIKYVENTQCVYLNDENVSEKIRTPEISLFASRVSVVYEVRQFLLSIQRNLAQKNSVIMDGRDIGTVILPNANIKIFLTASDEKRAKRRYLELHEKNKNITFENVLHDMQERDKKDICRDIAPLKKADDAILLDTSDLSLEQSIQAVIDIVNNYCNLGG